MTIFIGKQFLTHYSCLRYICNSLPLPFSFSRSFFFQSLIFCNLSSLHSSLFSFLISSSVVPFIFFYHIIPYFFSWPHSVLCGFFFFTIPVLSLVFTILLLFPLSAIFPTTFFASIISLKCSYLSFFLSSHISFPLPFLFFLFYYLCYHPFSLIINTLSSTSLPFCPYFSFLVYFSNMSVFLFICPRSFLPCTSLPSSFLLFSSSLVFSSSHS